MTPEEAKKILQSAMMNEYQLTEVDYASLINAIIEMQKENELLRSQFATPDNVAEDDVNTRSVLRWNHGLHKQYNERILMLESENAELKAQLENAIVPKFKTGDLVYKNLGQQAIQYLIQYTVIEDEQVYYWLQSTHPEFDIGHPYIPESKLFATKAEALESLKDKDND